MPRGMSEDVSNVIVQALNRGLSRSQISGVVGVSRRAITRINTNLKKHGSPKAPPKGLKLGRPTKLTKSQAEAMVMWMAERNHTFYVKDLVRFLRDGYGYRGCDGTARRCLVRAGYRRKLPWHKSEITTWVPPDHEPVFATVDDPQPGIILPEDGVDNENETEDQNQPEQDDSIRPDIDPALQNPSPLLHQPFMSQTQTHQAHPNTSYIASDPAQESTLPPSPSVSQLIASPPNPNLPSLKSANHSPTVAQRDDPDPSTANVTSNDSQPPPQPDDQTQISTLQSQIAQQQALILSLQQQLAQQSG